MTTWSEDRSGYSTVGVGALAVGFGATVAMWAVGYLGRLPLMMAPSPVLLVLMLACLFAGGVWFGRRTACGFLWGAAAGALSGLLNLLILGSLLAGDQPDQLIPSALWWVPGSIVVCAALAGLGAMLGAPNAAASPLPAQNWVGLFAWVAVAATLLLLFVGGLVTSAEAGLAVADWPTSFGYNMFLYPLSRMTGGIYYEHAHRLFGALVGLTTLFLAVLLQRGDRRAWMRKLGWGALAMVVAQGLMGGLRVTELSLPLALAHGVFGQIFFATLIALGTFTSTTWLQGPPPRLRSGVAGDRIQAAVLVGLMICQLLLGAVQRHLQTMLWAHIVVGVGLVAPFAVHVGFRSWGRNEGVGALQRSGLVLVGAVTFQVLLGVMAFAVLSAGRGGTQVGLPLAVATLHQWFGAVLLAAGVIHLCLTHRLIAEAPQHGQSPAPAV